MGMQTIRETELKGSRIYLPPRDSPRARVRLIVPKLLLEFLGALPGNLVRSFVRPFVRSCAAAKFY